MHFDNKNPHNHKVAAVLISCAPCTPSFINLFSPQNGIQKRITALHFDNFMNRISFITLGCKLNYAETSTYERRLLESGAPLEVAPWSEGADIFLVNTCSVTEHSDKKCRNIIRKLHRVSPGAAIFVTGCYAELKRGEIEALEGVRAVFGAKEKNAVVPGILKYLAGSEDNECGERRGGIFKNVPDGKDESNFLGAYSTGERTRSFLKVQDGCDYKCNYCTVPYARGESRNEPVADIVRKAEKIAAAGCREIVITGVNTGDFGKSTGENFFDLIRELDKVEGIERYRISSIEPNLLTEPMIDWIVSGTKFLPHFHIPLQSGSDTVLREMGRRYGTEAFARKIEYIRKAFGDRKVFFGIDVIVGFPGETDGLFEETYNFLKERIRPAFIHIFPYSKRAGTPAAVRKDQVQDSVKTERVARLEELCAELHRDFVSSCLGDTAGVLFESADKKGKMCGYTENYIKVWSDYEPSLIGRNSEVVLSAENTRLEELAGEE